MAIQIKLYSFSKKENSTLAPEGDGTSFDCLVKTPSSLMTPFIELQNATNPVLYNYAYIPDFHRYYFITDWKFDRGLWYATLMVDVLATFRVSIGAQQMYVLRSSNQKDGYLKDNLFPLSSKVSYDSTIFESGPNIGYQDGYFVITTVGDANQAGQTIYQMNATEFQSVLNDLMAQAGSAGWSGLGQGLINSLFNPTDYIVSAFWFPRPFSTTGVTPRQFACGLWKTTNTYPVIGNIQTAIPYTINVPKHPQASARGQYLNLSPYSYYELDMGFMRTIPLDTSKLVDVSQILVTVTPDPMTGIAKVEGRTQTANHQMQLFNVTCNYGVPINIAMGKNNLMNAISDIITVGAEGAIGGVLGAVGSAIGVADDVARSVIGTVTNTGSVGSLSGHRAPKRLFSRFFEVADNDNDHLGSPYCKVTTPNTLLGGYIIAEDCDIAISWATKAEIDQIKRYVTTGFFYEL